NSRGQRGGRQRVQRFLEVAGGLWINGDLEQPAHLADAISLSWRWSSIGPRRRRRGGRQGFVQYQSRRSGSEVFHRGPGQTVPPLRGRRRRSVSSAFCEPLPCCSQLSQHTARGLISPHRNRIVSELKSGLNVSGGGQLSRRSRFQERVQWAAVCACGRRF